MPARKKTTTAGDAPATGRTRKASPPAGNGNGDSAAPRKTRSPAAAGSGQTLVIVESPAKAKTINKYLGSNYRVLASYGHVRDLPRRRKKGEQVAGVNIDAGTSEASLGRSRMWPIEDSTT